MQGSDLEELKQFVADLKSDRATQKEKEKKDAWTKHVSLSMVVIAVLAAVATLKGGGFTTLTLKQMNEATFNQSQASDQWAFYQAKSIKQNLYELELDHLKATGVATPEAMEKAKTKVDKYDKDKADIKQKAEKFEAARDAARAMAANAAEHSKAMGLAITIFQISIALGAVCLIVKRKPLWFVSSALGLAALVQMIRVLYYMPM